GKYVYDTSAQKIKSVDPVTYDDDGNVIPLSKRFNKRSDDVRFSIFGEEGVRRMENAVQLLENLSTAKQMTADGKDAKVIKLATGWELGGDGKWRMEMPDLTMKTTRIYGEGSKEVEAPVDMNGWLDVLVDAPEIFEAYPELRGIYVKMKKLNEGSGVYHHDASEIWIDPDKFLSERDLKRIEELKRTIERSYNWTETQYKNAKLLGIEGGPEAVREKAQKELDAIRDRQLYWYRDILVHEVQHAIQHIEGFAPGSSPSYFERNPIRSKEADQALEEAIQNEYKVRKQFEDHPELLADFHRYYQLNDENYSDESMIEDESAVINEMEEIDQKFRDAGLGDLWDQYYIARSELKAARYKAEHGAVPSSTAYFNTAGEVEARNVQRRRNYTMEERLNSLLSETENVAEKDKIYLNRLVRGGSEMAADEDGKYFPAPDEWGTAYTSMTGKGLQAILFLLEKKDGFVPAAFNRPEIGDIDIVYGKTGFGIDDKGGYGLAHIEKRRGKGHVDWEIFANTITNGTYVPKGESKVYFIDKKSKVIVKL
ncbi:MAG: hypothetical protein J6Q65_01350, partial [Lentisphaeria bacterium]|nr:hypothetical protein [Lentisphaeria bacterium]